MEKKTEKTEEVEVKDTASGTGYSHKGHPLCVCTDGREDERDVTEMCNS